MKGSISTTSVVILILLVLVVPRPSSACFRALDMGGCGIKGIVTYHECRENARKFTRHYDERFRREEEGDTDKSVDAEVEDETEDEVHAKISVVKSQELVELPV